MKPRSSATTPMTTDANPLKAFGHQLQKRRKSWGLSQSRLAELSGLTQATISAIERGTANPTIESLQQLSAALNGEIIIQIRNRRHDKSTLNP